jgi:hypothetical protein
MWFGQLLSLVGSEMTAFGLGVYVYRQTGSATQFALITLFIYVPQILATVLAGVWADRYHRRHLLIIINVAATVASVALIAIVTANVLNVWIVYVMTFLFAICNATQFPPFAASVPLLVPKQHLGRANGMVQFALVTSWFVAPVLAALLLSVVGLRGIVAIDLVTFVIDIPQPAPTGQRRSVLTEAVEGWRYILGRPGLAGLLLFFAVANVGAGLRTSLATPMVLSFASTLSLGLIASAGGAAVILGSILMIVWGGPKRRMNLVLPAGIAFGVFTSVLGLAASLPLIAVATFGLSFCLPVINAANAAIWQATVPAGIQGRVMATVRMVAWSTVPIVGVVSGPLADHVFNPVLAPDGALAGSVGRVIGTGPGRGIGFMFVLAGLMPIAAGVLAYRSRSVRTVEDEGLSPIRQEQASMTSAS